MAHVTYKIVQHDGGWAFRGLLNLPVSWDAE